MQDAGLIPSPLVGSVRVLRPDLHDPIDAPPSLPTTHRSQFFSRVRGFKSMGLLAPSATRKARRSVCGGCEHSKPAEHGLYLCTNRKCGCGGGQEIALALTTTTCIRWQTSP